MTASHIHGLTMSRRKAIAVLCALPVISRDAFGADGWPTQPVKIILGQPAGSGSDPMVRGLVPHLAAAFGKPFIVENRLGGAGNIAAAAVAQATDGHTLGVVVGGPTTTAKTLNPALSYDPARDFRPISLLNKSNFVLTVHPGTFPASGFAGWLDQVRANPGRFSYASIGPGTVTHLAMEEMKASLGIDLVHVPYRGFPQATLDLMEGRVHAMLNVSSAALEHVATGRLAAIAQSGETRMKILSQTPTLRELGVPGGAFFGWSGMIAPAGFSGELAQRIAGIVREALRTDPLARGGLDRTGSEILGTDPAELDQLQHRETVRWSAVIKRLGLRLSE